MPINIYTPNFILDQVTKDFIDKKQEKSFTGTTIKNWLTSTKITGELNFNSGIKKLANSNNNIVETTNKTKLIITIYYL